MRSLDKFLDFLFGDRQVEYEPDLEELEARQLPLPLKYLYAFIGKYPSDSETHQFIIKLDAVYI